MHNDSLFKMQDTEIRTVEQFEYLGIIYEKKLNFIPHIKRLKQKCSKSLNLLRVIANTDWGADSKDI